MTEKPDFPFYAGRPVLLEGRQWLILMAALALGFAALSLLPMQGFPQSLFPALLFLLIPLLGLLWVAGAHWIALFRPVGIRQVGLMIFFGFLTLAGSMVSGLILSQFVSFSHNPISDTFASMTILDLVARLIPTLPQLIGEELLGIVPFLAVLWLCVTRLGLSRRAGIWIALIVSALIFGAAHLPTYDWHWGQALIGIGAARVFLTLAYIVTRNLWVSAGAHILNDWTGFLITFAMGHAPIATGT
ncbi:CPBP family intramembrane glutamic endopeptidase [Szabonella alba]|uniref:CPBP family intramembrane metalloprotease n=1 Tax=Szabonella alba TaxID=2804194 RepID=A0A8K0VGR3_9RHOB|nr:CPBP family intramembrane glutamic endopeptidase [Szabonella alba]MBL4919107.1 CPBP family intramembrane metalloprotease [Szabonella alba]